MLRFATRPDAGRAAFAQRADAHNTHLNSLFALDPPAIAAIGDYIKNQDAWKSGVKEHYSEHQNSKCAYCERMLTDFGDVEHFRPKNAIHKLKTKGEELPSLNNIRGRTYFEPDQLPKPSGTWDSGYWWLAYDWGNYLVACGRCNQNWKRALFPIKFGHRRRPQRGDEARESWLLDPYGSRPIADHLEFSSVGGIKARNGSRVGRESIDTYGLDRPSLVRSRLQQAMSTHRKLRQLLDASSDDARRPILEDLREMGDRRFAHAGMVRVIFEQATGWSWDDLNNWLGS